MSSRYPRATAIAAGVSIIDTPGHTRGHVSVSLTIEGEDVLVAGDALPDGGTVRRGVPYNIFWDVNDATESVEKMLDASTVFYPGHDLPFRLDGDEISYLDGPTKIEFITSNEGGSSPQLLYTVLGKRPPKIELYQKD